MGWLSRPAVGDRVTVAPWAGTGTVVQTSALWISVRFPDGRTRIVSLDALRSPQPAPPPFITKGS